MLIRNFVERGIVLLNSFIHKTFIHCFETDILEKEQLRCKKYFKNELNNGYNRHLKDLFFVFKLHRIAFPSIESIDLIYYLLFINLLIKMYIYKFILTIL